MRRFIYPLICAVLIFGSLTTSVRSEELAPLSPVFHPGDGLLLASADRWSVAESVDGRRPVNRFNGSAIADGLNSAGGEPALAVSRPAADSNDTIEIRAMQALTQGVDLAVQKSWIGGKPLPGQGLTYQIDYANQGNQAANEVIITDTLPLSTSFSYVYAPGWSYSVSGQTVTFTRSYLGSGSSGSLSLSLSLSNTLQAGDRLTNTVEIGSTAIDVDGGNNRAIHTMQIAPADRDLYIDKSLYRGVATPGREITYRLIYRNYGADAASDVVITDTLPVGMSYVSATGNFAPTVNGNQVIWRLGTVAGQSNSGYSGNLYLTVRLSDTLSVGTLLENAATIFTPDPESGLNPNEDRYTLTVQPFTRDMRVQKWVENGIVLPGNDIRYGISYQNQGNSAAENVLITDTLPLSATFLSASGAFTPTLQGNRLIWQLGTVSDTYTSGSYGYLYVTVHLSENLSAGERITNTAEIATSNQETDYSDNRFVVSSIVHPFTRDMYVEKWLNSGSLRPGNVVQYRIYYQNQGNSAAEKVIITDTLPLSTTFLSATGAFTPTQQGNRLIWQMGTVSGTGTSGSSGYLYATVRLSVDLPVGRIITNTVEIATTSPETDYGDNRYDLGIAVQETTPDLSLSKSLLGSLAAGSEITYRLDYYNSRSYMPANHTVLSDTLPAGMSFRRASWWLHNNSANAVPITPTISGQTLSFALGTIPGYYDSGNSGSIYLTVYNDVGVNPPGVSLTNRARITADNDANPANNASEQTATVVNPTRDLYLTTYLAGGEAVIGEEYVYVISYRNYGNAALENVVLTDTLPARVTFVAAEDDSGRPFPPNSVSGQTLTWNLGSVPGSNVSGYAKTIYVTVRLSGSTPVGATLINTVGIRGSQADVPNNYPNFASTTDIAEAPAHDLQITKSVYSVEDNYLPGTWVSWRLLYRNDGNVEESVTVTDSLPLSMTYHSAYSGNDSCCWTRVVSGTQVVWANPALAAHASGYLYVSGDLDPGLYRTAVLTNRAAIAARSIGLADTAAHSVTVQGPAIQVTPARLDLGVAYPGYPTNHTLQVRNTGQGTLQVSSISDDSPLLSVTPGSLSVPAGQTRPITVTFAPTQTGGFSGRITLVSNDYLTPTVIATVTATILEPPSIGVSPSAITASIAAGTTRNSYITINNTGASDLIFQILGASDNQLGLERILDDLDAGHEIIVDKIPNRYNFSDGVNGTGIGDGGGDMYDGGNYLSTNLGGSILYSDNIIASTPFLGPNGVYFTRKYPGLFVMAANLDGVEFFQVNGNLGADGSGSADGSVLTTEVNGITYHGFVKRVYSAGDPSVNHLIIIPESATASHDFSSYTDDDYHRVSGLLGIDRLYYLLYAGSSGVYIDDVAALAIMEAFLDTLDLLPPWLNANPQIGLMSVGSSQEVTVTLDASDLISGTYAAALSIRSNDPATPQVTIPITLYVGGNPVAAVEPDSLEFGDIFAGGNGGLPFEVRNDGTSDLLVLGIIPSDPALSVSATDFNVQPRSSRPLTLTYAPTSTGTLSATVAITTNDPVTPTLLLRATGRAVPPPVLKLQPNIIERTIASNEIQTATLTISNTGGSDLQWVIAGTSYVTGTGGLGGGRVGIVGAASANLNATLNGDNLLGDRYTFTNLGDNWSYTTIQPYDMLLVAEGDSSLTTSEADALLRFYESGRSIVLGMDDVDSLSSAIRSTIYTIFGVTNARDGGFNHGALSNHPVAADIISIDNFSDGDNDHFEENGAEWVARDSDGNNYVLAYQGAARTVILGEVLTAWYSASPQLVRNAIEWSGFPWLEAQPLSGTVASGASAQISVTLDARRLVSDTYSAQIYLASNDPVRPQVSVPVTLHVTGTHGPAIFPEVLDFGTIFASHPVSLPLQVINRGADGYRVTAITASDPAFTAAPGSFAVTGYGSRRVDVTFAPTAQLAQTATLTIRTNSTLTPTVTVALTGTVVLAPAIRVSPAALAVTEGTGVTTTRTLLVENLDSGTLDFDLRVINSVISVDPISGTLVGQGQQPITVTFDTTTRQPGFYTSRIDITSNDPVTPSISVPVSLTVFLQAPELPVNPNPQDGQINVRVDQSLSWRASPHATSYNISLWEEGDPKPATPTVENTGQASYNPPGNLPTGTTFHWQVTARNVVSDTTSAEWSFTTETLPDVAVTSVTAPPAGFSGASAEFNWVVTNRGDRGTTASTWWENVYISSSPTFDAQTAIYLGQVSNAAYLGTGESYQQTAAFNLPQSISGDYYVFVRTDIYNYMRESDENNTGRSASTFDISLTPPPDLQVTSLSGPANAFSGDPVSVRWTVKNSGGGSTRSSVWYDAIFLSQDITFTLDSDVFLANVPHNGQLAVGASYTGTATVNLPQAIFGDYYFFVVTDYGNAIFEHVLENNNTGGPSAPVAITLSPPPDLEVTRLSAPANADAGSAIQMEWVVTNNGAGAPFEGYWQDRIYLSTSATFTTSAVTVLGTFGQYGSLAPGDRYTRTQSFTLANGISGTHYIHVWTDFANQVFEFQSDDNNTASSNPMAVVRLPSPDLQVQRVYPAGATNYAPGSPVQLGWVVVNAADPTSTTAWVDRIYLSTSPSWNGNGTQLGSFERPQSLDAGERYTQTRTVLLPSNLGPGVYYLYVMADAADAIYEHNGEDNNVRRGNSFGGGADSNGLAITLPPPADLALGRVSAPAFAESGRPITLTWTVSNTGSTATDATSWLDTAYLSADRVLNTGSDTRLADWTHSGRLNPGAGYTRSESLVLPNGIQGEYTLFLLTDSQNGVTDGNRANNQLAATPPISVTLSTTPDLAPAAVNPVSAGVAGQPVTVTWTVRNGGAAASGVWYDTIYFSTDPTPDASDTRLTSQIHTGGLVSGGVYTKNASVTIPNNATGAYYLLVQSDSRNEIYEHNAEHNNVAAWPINVQVPPPSDLVVTSVTVPADARPGDPVTIEWVVANRGASAVNGYLCDAVFISPDTTWDINDARLDNTCYTIDLAAGGMQTMRMQTVVPEKEALAGLSARAGGSGNLTDNLPGVTPGQYHAIVRTDIFNNIRESDETNNAGASTSTLLVDVTELTLGTPLTATLGTGESRFYRVDVPAGETLLISLDSDSASAANELYVRYGQAPSRGNFDYSYSAPFEADQEVVVPSTMSGTHYVMIYSSTSADSQNISVAAELLQFGIRSASSTLIGNQGTATLEIEGAKYGQKTYFELVDLAGVRVTDTQLPTKTIVVNSALAFAILNVDGITVGDYLLRAVDDGNVSNTIPIQITGGGGILEADVIAPRNARPGQVVEIIVNYQNTGISDLLPPLIFANNESGKVFSVLNTLYPHIDSAMILIGLASEGLPGTLAPGASGQVRLRTIATDNNADLDIRVFEAGNTPFDWIGMADSLVSEASRNTSQSEPTARLSDLNLSDLDDAVDQLRREIGDSVRDVVVDIAWDATKAGVKYAAIHVKDWVAYKIIEKKKQIEDGVDAIVDIGKETITDAGVFNPSTDVTVTLYTRSYSETLPTTVIVHGWNNDVTISEPQAKNNTAWMRVLAQAIVDADKRAGRQRNILLAGWGPGAIRFFPNHAAYNINAAGVELARKLKEDYGIAGDKRDTVDFIGHSFGTYVANKTVDHLGYARNIVALDPALELGLNILNVPNTYFGGLGTAYSSNAGYLVGKPKYVYSIAYHTSCLGSPVANAYEDYTVLSDLLMWPWDRHGYATQFWSEQTQIGGSWGINRSEIIPRIPNVTRVGGFEGTLTSDGAFIANSSDPALACREIDNIGDFLVGEWDDLINKNSDYLLYRFFVQVPVVRAVDPNDILGPAGYGDANWIAADTTLGYTIRFENDETQATAPAQRVTIEQTLDPDLDPRRFRLGSFGFGDHIFSVPDNRSFYQERLGPLTITTTLPTTRTFDLYVDVQAGIDIVTGKAFWTFQSIDPATGATPTDADAGFLPPDVIEGLGQGFVTYQIRAKSNAQTGAVVDAQARIVFDDNAPIDTPPIFHTLDAGTPTSAMQSLPAETSDPDIVLAWTSGDDENGSGVGSVDVYVATDGGPFALWKAGVAESSAIFVGDRGHSYRFFALASDNAGNREPSRSGAEASTLLFQPGAPHSVILTPVPAQLVADGASTSSVKAAVLDGGGNVVPGQVVTFAVSLGSVTPISLTTDVSGTVSTLYTAPTLAGKVHLTATTGAVYGTTVLTLTAGAPTTVTLTAFPTGLTVGKTSILTATLIDRFANPIQGRVLSFAASLGAVSPVTRTTSTQGVVTTTLTSTVSGSAAVTVTVAGLSDSVNVTFNPGAPANMALSATPGELVADGVSTSTLRGSIVDVYGNPVLGRVLSFAASLGSVNPISPTTDVSGAASTLYTAPTLAGKVYLTATTGSLSAATQLTLTAGAPMTVTLTAFPTGLTVGKTSILTATVIDRFANPIQGRVLSFAASLGAVSPVTRTTSTQGVVTTTLTSTVSGSAAVTVTVAGLSDSVNVTFNPGAPANMALSATPGELVADGVSTSTLRGSIVDVYGNPVPGRVLSFTASLGSVNPISPTTDVSGAASTLYTAPTLAGKVYLTATTGSLSAAIQLTLTAGAPTTVTLTGHPIGLTVGETSVLTATLTDRFANPIPGRVLSFAASLGAVSPVTRTSSTQGVVTTTLTSTVSGSAAVTVTVAGLSNNVVVTFNPGAPANMALSATPGELVADGVSTSTLRGSIVDVYGNPVPGRVLSFTASLGSVNPISPTTDVSGAASTLYTAPTLAGKVYLTATTGSLSAAIQLTLTAGAPTTVTLTGHPIGLTVGETSVLTATVIDRFANPIAGNVVTFTTTLGSVSPITRATNVQGIVTATLSSTLSGNGTVAVTAGSLSDDLSLFFAAGAPVSVNLTADPDRLLADGSSTSLIRGVVSDGYGNAVTNQIVAFTTGLGSLFPMTATSDVSGRVAVTFTAPNTAGAATIRADAGPVSGTVTVVLMPVSLDAVTVAGPYAGIVEAGYTFIAAATPITLTRPVTYIWSADGYAPIAVNSGISSSALFTWSTAGPKVVTVTAMNAGGAVTATRVITVYDRSLVINELDYAQFASDNAEFVEIVNTGSATIDLGFIALQLVDGSNGSIYSTVNLPAVDLTPGSYFVLCVDGASVPNCDLETLIPLQDGAPSAVALAVGDVVIDAVSYGGDSPVPYVEGSGVTALDDGSAPALGLSRWPDSVDTNQNSLDFSLRCVTPGRSNTWVADYCEAAQLGISKSVWPAGIVEPGDAITYTLAFSNAGHLTAQNVSITDTMPVSVSVTGVYSTGVMLEEKAPFVWQIADLETGMGGIIILTGVISELLPVEFSLVNEASISSETHEDSIADNSSLASLEVNIAPTAVDDSQSTSVNTPILIDVLANDSDPGSDPLQVVAVDMSSSWGTAVITDDDWIEYTPPTNFVGMDSFTYALSDGDGGTDTATVTITVTEIAIADLNAESSPTLIGSITYLTATTSNGSNVSFAWDFGDGGYGDGAAVSHVYAELGTYTATVTATNSLGSVAATTVVDVEDIAGQPGAGSITPGTGGTVENSDGEQTIAVSFDPGTVAEPAVVRVAITTGKPITIPAQQVALAFSVSAIGPSGVVTEFNQPFTITIVYDDSLMTAEEEASIQLYFWDENANTYRMIPATVDTDRNLLIAVLDHLTEFALIFQKQTVHSLYLPRIFANEGDVGQKYWLHLPYLWR